MKSNRKKKILAAILCMVMVLTNNFSILAEGAEASETAAVTAEETPTAEAEVPEKEVTVQPEEQSEPEKMPKKTALSEATELTQELKDANGEVVQKVTAKLPEGAFEAENSAITMEVTYVEHSSEEYIKNLMLKHISEGNELGDYLLYKIEFKVNGETKNPLKPVEITLDKSNLEIQNAEQAKVFCFHQTDLQMSEDAIIETGENQRSGQITFKGSKSAIYGCYVEKEIEKEEVPPADEMVYESAQPMETALGDGYTIEWTDYGKSIKLHFVNEKGDPLEEILGVEESKTIKVLGTGNLNDANISLSDIGKKYNDPQKGLYFAEAHINSPDGPVSTNFSYNLNAEGKGWIYWAQGKWNKWRDGFFSPQYGKRDVYMVYVPSKLTTVETVDSEKDGITMKLKDLDNIVDIGGHYITGNNIEGTIKQGLVERKLNAAGYPVATKENLENKNLDSLFSGGVEANHLFRSDIFKETGYYEYSSFENYAYLGTGKDFTVYNQLGTPYDYDVPAKYFFQRGNFFPYNKIVEGGFANLSRNLYDENGKKLSPLKERYNERLYMTQGRNFHFSMDLSANFTQQRDGIATHVKPDGQIVKSPMIYEFNGDDDLWIFIDGVLVLDIGGIHDAHSGKIDFQTGDVTWWDCAKGEDPVPKSTTIKNMFREAGVLPNGDPWPSSTQQDTINKYFDGNTFADYTNHTFKMFYMERGEGASNLHVKFNLPMIPKNTVNVTKIVTDDQGQEVNYTKNIDFRFEISVNEQPHANKYYKIMRGNQKVGEGRTDEKGQFTLKRDQTAQFAEIPDNAQYRVRELGAFLNGYEVHIDGTKVDVETEQDETETLYAADSGLLPTSDPSVTFTNIVKDTVNLEIKKKLAEGTIDKGKIYRIKLFLDGVPYDGSYTVNGTTTSAKEGIIELKANETANIIGLPSGVTFKAYEVMDGSYLPTYEIKGAASNIEIPQIKEDGTSNGISDASAQMNGNCELIVTNKEQDIDTGTTSVQVIKKWEDMKDIPLPEYIEVYLYQDVNRNGEVDESDTLVYSEAKRLNANNWTARWDNLPKEVDYVVKEVYPPGYKLSTTVSDDSFTQLTQIGDRNTPNNNMTFKIGQNNLLLVKGTDNKYFLWSPTELKLDEKDKQGIADDINKLGLQGVENLNSNNLEYKWGVENFSNIVLEKLDDGWKLSFTDKGVWKMFWIFKYHRIQTITLTNTLDKDAQINIKVKKEWVGDKQEERPENVTVWLYQDDKKYDEAILNSSNQWQDIFENLPIYEKDKDGTIVKKYEYTVKEAKIGDTVVDENGNAEGYQSSVTSGIDTDGSIIFTITNSKDWQIVKVSHNSNDLKLEGAIFKLTKNDNEFTVYGASDGKGVVRWYKKYENQNCSEPYEEAFETGIYTLEEIKAPSGYAKSEETWTIQITDGRVEQIVSSVGNTIITSDNPKGGKETYYFKNTPLYELPSAGGTGTFVYTIGGTLLLMAAALLLYKMKRKEVLKS